MANIERTDQKLTVRSGSTTLTLDKVATRAVMERKVLLWTRKPLERSLGDIVAVNIDANVDHASGVELCSPMLVMRDGSAWALPHTDRNAATEMAASIRSFLAIA